MDDDEEDLWLASGLERVRMHLPLGKHLTPAGPGHIHTLSHTLLQQSRSTSQGRLQSMVRENRNRLEHLREVRIWNRMTDRTIPGMQRQSDCFPIVASNAFSLACMIKTKSVKDHKKKRPSLDDTLFV